MTRDETKQILMTIDAIFPNWKVTDLTATINAWHVFLREYKYQDIMDALKMYVSISGSGFAPSAPQLIEMVSKPNEYKYPSEGEVVTEILKAIGSSTYYADENFEKLSDISQQIVHAPSQLRQWAMDESFNEGVITSHIRRQYRNAVERVKELERMPADIRARIEQIAGGSLEVGEPLLIGGENG